jgi:hypothetical protein
MYDPFEPDEIIVFHRRWQLAVVAAGALLSVAGGIAILSVGLRSGGFDLVIRLPLAASVILFFGWWFVLAVDTLRTGMPLLRISADGIYDGSSAISAGLVPWEEIASVHRACTRFQTFVCIVPKTSCPCGAPTSMKMPCPAQQST